MSPQRDFNWKEEFKRQKLEGENIIKTYETCNTIVSSRTEHSLSHPSSISYPENKELLITEIQNIEKYISESLSKISGTPINWDSRTLMERYSYAIASEFCEFILEDNYPDYPTLGVYDDTPMYDLLLAIDDFACAQACRDLSSENIINKEGVEIREATELYYPSYKSCLFPLVVESFFQWLEESDNRFTSIRYRSWMDRTMSEFFTRTKSFESNTTYRGEELSSPGHLKICKRLEDDGVMFFFEAPTFLVGDKKQKRRMDLVVIKNNRAVIVEIDGYTYHRSRTQQEDDNERDRLIRKNWNNTLRLSHDEAMNRTNEAIQKIYDAVDPTRGSIS